MTEDRFDFYELRHFGASYMLNVLGLEPWVIAEQLRHTDGGALVVELYGHPERGKAISASAAPTARVRQLHGTAPARPPARRGNFGGQA